MPNKVRNRHSVVHPALNMEVTFHPVGHIRVISANCPLLHPTIHMILPLPLLLSALLAMPSRAAAVSATAGTPKVLVYTATAGYRHDSIPTAIQVLGDHASDYGVDFVFSE